MNCLFCKQVSDNSISVEHIIPESLGNKEHILPKGMVCDSCNQYFARKVEKKLLEQPYFKNTRHRNLIESKKKRIPFEKAIIMSPIVSPSPVDLYWVDNNPVLDILDKSIVEKLKNSKSGSIIIPHFDTPENNNLILSRFLAKVSTEALLYRFMDEEGWIEEIQNKSELDLIKKYARFGRGVKYWPYHQRRLYSEETRFLNPKIGSEPYEVLHEFQFFHTKEMEFYFVIAIMGIEYAINMGGPDITTYQEWLQEHNEISVLDDSNERR